MKFGRADYQDRIVDQEGLIPEDEPVFLLRGQDTAAAEAVRIWADIHEAGGGDEAMAKAARNWADEMEKYSEVHGKTADMLVEE